MCDTPKEEILKGNWVQADGRCVMIRNMTDTHLKNTIRMIEDGRLKREWALPYLRSEVKRRERLKMINDFWDYGTINKKQRGAD